MTDLVNDALVASLCDAARRVTADRGIRDLATTVDRLVHAAVDAIPKAAGGGITRTDGRVVRSSHSTSADISRLDRLQSELGQGPCITASDDAPLAGIVLAEDLDDEDARRWPRFAPAAVDAGYRSLMSVGLSVGSRRSALNLYGREPGVFVDTSSQLTAELFGLQAATLLHGAEHAATLDHAIESRDVVGQATGILMERFGVDDNEAFAMLAGSSRDTDCVLVDVARSITRETNARHRTSGTRSTR